MAESRDIVTHPFTVSFIRTKAGDLCRRSDFSRSDFEDLEQDMRMYLLEKAHLFDPTRGRLEAFVNRVVSSWVAIRLRYRSREKRRDSYKAQSLERTRVECEGEITSLGFVLLEEDGRRLGRNFCLSDIEQFELNQAVECAMGSLAPQDRDILAHVAEYGVADAARTFGVSRRQIENAVARARSQFEKAGLRPERPGRSSANGIGNQ